MKIITLNIDIKIQYILVNKFSTLNFQVLVKLL